MVRLSAINNELHTNPISLIASAGVRRKDLSTEIGGYHNFNTENRFRYYQQLSTCTPHVSTSLNKLGLSLVKGMQFDGRNKLIVENFERWARRVNFIEQAQTMARLLCRDGTYLAAMEGDVDDLHLIPLLMPNTTIHPKGYDAEKDKDVLLAPPVKTAVINEGQKREDKTKEKIIPIDELVYGTYNAWDSIQKDVKNRDTYGIYGASLLDPIELSIRNLLNINHG